MLNPAICLAIWEAGYGLDPVNQLYLLLQALYPETAMEQLQKLTLGQANARLLEVMQTLDNGKAIVLEQDCPACNQLIGVTLTYEELFQNYQDEVVDGVYETDGYHFTYRHVNLKDMEEAVQAFDSAFAKKQMLENCVQVTQGQYPVVLADVPGEIINKVEVYIEQRDPLAVIEVGLLCPDCQHQSSSMFDPGRVFWHKVNHVAKDLLTEIAKLTRHYGWTEEYIVSMSPAKRAFYLELAESGKL